MSRLYQTLLFAAAILVNDSASTKAQSPPLRATPAVWLAGFHAGGFDNDAGGILSAGVGLRYRYAAFDAFPLDVGMLAGSPNSAYTTDARGNCHGPDGRFTSKSNCGAPIDFRYGASGEARMIPDRRWPWELGLGYRWSSQVRGPYAAISSPITRETAKWLSVAARLGAKLYTVGVAIRFPAGGSR